MIRNRLATGARAARVRFKSFTAYRPQTLTPAAEPAADAREAVNEPVSIARSSPEPDKPARTQRSRLRPRRAAMTLSPSAVKQLQMLLDQPQPKLLRIGIKAKGCSGSAYSLDYVDHKDPFDELVDQDGVQVLIDSRALLRMIGSEMDWVDDQLSSRFVFHNPNVKEECGCGESMLF